jgi:hypothetical protein
MLWRLRRALLDSCRSFADLHAVVSRAIRSVPGVGELTVYDTALRIGAKLGFARERVYLHAGTRQGAKRLALDWQAESVSLE